MARDPARPPVRRPIRFLLALGLLAALGGLGCAPSAVVQGQRALDDGDPAGALSHFEQALEADEATFRGLRGRGAARLELGDSGAALADLRRAEELQPDDPTLLWLLGRAYETDGQIEAAAAVYERYSRVSDERSVQRVLRHKLAELHRRSAHQGADRLLALLETSGYEPDPHRLAVYAFVPADSASRRDQELCRAFTVFVADDFGKVAALDVIAADKLDLIYEELEITYQSRQFFDPASFVVPGNIFPARHMVRGSLATAGDGTVALGLDRSDAIEPGSADPVTGRGSLEDIFTVEGRTVLRLLEDLRVPVTEAEKDAILRRPTRVLDALFAFAHGLFLLERGDLTGAQTSFREATDLDPDFALAAAAADDVEVRMAGGAATLVPAPKVRTPVEVRAVRSAMQVGTGLVPDEERGQSTSTATENNTAVHGDVTLEVRASIEGSTR